MTTRTSRAHESVHARGGVQVSPELLVGRHLHPTSPGSTCIGHKVASGRVLGRPRCHLPPHCRTSRSRLPPQSPPTARSTATTTCSSNASTTVSVTSGRTTAPKPSCSTRSWSAGTAALRVERRPDQQPPPRGNPYPHTSRRTGAATKGTGPHNRSLRCDLDRHRGRRRGRPARQVHHRHGRFVRHRHRDRSRVRGCRRGRPHPYSSPRHLSAEASGRYF